MDRHSFAPLGRGMLDSHAEFRSAPPPRVLPVCPFIPAGIRLDSRRHASGNLWARFEYHVKGRFRSPAEASEATRLDYLTQPCLASLRAQSERHFLRQG